MNITEPLTKMAHAQRVALAGSLLESQTRDRQFEPLLLLDRDAFRPYAELVLGWDDARLRQLRDAYFRNFWQVARGASDDTVDTLFETIHANLDALGQSRADVTHYRVLLLIGVDTERAHVHLADLARRSPEVARHCRQRHLLIPAAGPAVRRFTPDFLDVNAYVVEEGEVVHTSGLAFPLDAADYLPENRGWVCRSPPAHILTAQLDLLQGDPLAASPLKMQHWFLPSGEECCDEGTVGHSLAYRVLPDATQLVALVANLSYPDETRDMEGACSYEDYGDEPYETQHRLVLEPFIGQRLTWPNHHLGRLGGYPEWWQQPQVPDCPACGRLMFYVGQVHACAVRDDVIDAALYAFHCEDCGIGAQIVQIT